MYREHTKIHSRVPRAFDYLFDSALVDLSSVVQTVPPTVALVELKGALRYHGTDTCRLGAILRIRALSRLGIDVRVGIGPTITVAATASAQVPPLGGPRYHPGRSGRLADSTSSSSSTG